MSVYLSNSQCNVNADGSRKGHIEINAKASVPFDYDGIIEYEVKQSSGKVATGKCRVTSVKGVVAVCGPVNCPFAALNDNSGVVCQPNGEVDYILNVGDELMFGAVTGSVGATKSVIDSGDSGVPKATNKYQEILCGSSGNWEITYGDSDPSGYGKCIGAHPWDEFGVPKTTAESKRYCVVCVAKDKILADGAKFHVSFDLEAAEHTRKSSYQRIDIVGACTKNGTVYGLGDVMANVHQMYTCGNTSSSSGYLLEMLTNIVYKVVNDELFIYFVMSQGAYPVYRFRVLNPCCDEDCRFVWENKDYETTTQYDSLDEFISNKPMSVFVPVPKPSTSDNGKVLKVVSGMPTWASA